MDNRNTDDNEIKAENSAPEETSPLEEKTEAPAEEAVSAEPQAEASAEEADVSDEATEAPAEAEKENASADNADVKPESDEKPASETAAKPAKKSRLSVRTKAIIAIVASFIGVAAIVLGIVLPFALNDEYIDDEGVNPLAVIKLSNKMELKFEIYESDCPNAATNFIYLASIGYFDGTVIYDGTNGWVRFGGFLTDGTHRGDGDTDFLAGITDRKYVNAQNTEYDRSGNKFGYRLKEDKNRSAMRNQLGELQFCYERSATEFQIIADVNSFGDTIDNGGGEWKSAPFAHAADQKTIDNIVAIYGMSRDAENKDDKIFKHDYYRAPLDGSSLITIKSVKVTRKYAPKWKKFSFMEYFYGSGSSSSVGTWYSSQKKVGEK